MRMKREQQLATLAQGLVSTMYSNGSSPLHVFGTTWEKLSDVEHENPDLVHGDSEATKRYYGQ